MKYVIITVRNMEVPIVFPSFVPHATFKELKPVAAGFCRAHDNQGLIEYHVRGVSTSLGLKSREGDSLLLTKTLNFKDIGG